MKKIIKETNLLQATSSKLKATRGFTLLELVIVIAVMAIMVFMVSSFYGTVIKNIDLDATASVIISDLKNTQILAMSGYDGNKWGICFIHNTAVEPDVHRYDVVSPPGACAAGGADNVKRTIFLPSGITFSDPAVDSAELIVFNKIDGVKSAAGDSAITINFQNNSKTITVTAQGRIYK